MHKLTKNIICFHGGLTNNYIMCQQMKNIIDNGNYTIILKESDDNHVEFKHIGSSNYTYDFPNGHLIAGDVDWSCDGIKERILERYAKKMFARLYGIPSDARLYGYIRGKSNFNWQFRLKKYDVTAKDYYKEYNTILNDINELKKFKDIKYDCAISFSSGVYPLGVMLEHKLVKNAIIICPSTIKDKSIFENITGANILCIVGAKDDILNDSLKTYQELKKYNNCELFVTTKGHSIPNLDKQDIVSIEAINKIHKFIENCSIL